MLISLVHQNPFEQQRMPRRFTCLLSLSHHDLRQLVHGVAEDLVDLLLGRVGRWLGGGQVVHAEAARVRSVEMALLLLLQPPQVAHARAVEAARLVILQEHLERPRPQSRRPCVLPVDQ